MMHAGISVRPGLFVKTDVKTLRDLVISRRYTARGQVYIATLIYRHAGTVVMHLTEKVDCTERILFLVEATFRSPY